MILKEREKPIILSKLESLKARLKKSHPKYEDIQKELANRKAGYKGEKMVDFYLSYLPKDFYLLHDLRLGNPRGTFFQIDTLIITSKIIYLIEIKNYRGTIQFDHHFHQFIQHFNGERRALQDPISQVKNQTFQLEQWLYEYQFPQLPIQPIIAISHPSTIIETTNNPELSKFITHAINLNTKITSSYDHFQKELISKKTIFQIAERLKKMNRPLDYPILDHFHVQTQDIIQGVICPNCSRLPMKRVYGKWICPICKSTSTNAHINALHDYSLLFGDQITNRQTRHFLACPSRHVVTRILKSMNLPHDGKNKATVYSLHFHQIKKRDPLSTS